MKRLWSGQDTFTTPAAAATGPPYGALVQPEGAMHDIKRNFAQDFGTSPRAEEPLGTLKVAKDGILAAFEQLQNDSNFKLGGGGGGGGGGGSGGGQAGTPGDLKSLVTPKQSSSVATAAGASQECDYPGRRWRQSDPRGDRRRDARRSGHATGYAQYLRQREPAQK
ncbi:MAG: hypothetical protein USCAAHI_00900 [Beijerinckiaceae bacterium]|nr:MAG: hypothetical protein USCAAHI_00900 [Beijerinckiaceae bacterium]